MSDDLLSRATRSLREETEEASEANDGALTMARVERSLRGAGVGDAGRARRRGVLRARWVILPIAAVFVVMGAWASASGRLGGWLVAWGGKSESESERKEDRDRDRDRDRDGNGGSARGASLAPVLVAPSASASASASALAPASAPAPARAAASGGISIRRTGDGNGNGNGNAESEADSLYRVGHEAQFGRRDYGAAVVAWDRYLAVAGAGGRFALEARYNRGVALVKLGRAGEARAALQPFADGEYGGYRRDEARALLRSLD